MSTTLHTSDVKYLLNKLGYYDGPINNNYRDGEYRDDLRRFQRDYNLVADGWYGRKTEKPLLALDRKLIKSNMPCMKLRRWQLTKYWIGNATRRPGRVPLVTPKGKVIARVSPGAFVEASLEGTTRIGGGDLVNVASGPKYRRCDRETFVGVYKIAKRSGWISQRRADGSRTDNLAGYAGIRVDSEHRYATHAHTFKRVPAGPGGWPKWNRIEAIPFRTLAADLGRLRRHDPKWKGKGGLVPVATRVFILEFVGKKLPDGTIHDGWFTVNDTGGAIFGAHFDIFTGSRQWAKLKIVPSLGHIWFSGVEDRIPMDYRYGLA